jgi:hypothetical protein
VVPQAADLPDEPLDGKSATACWKMVQDRINQKITRLRKLDPSLSPPPGTVISGPEYFGLNIPETVEQLGVRAHP